MSIGDFLSNVGHGLATGARAVGAVAGPVVQSLAEEESGQAPEIQQEKRQQAMKLQSAAITSKAQDLESQLEMGRKYGTLTPDQQQQYVDAITTLYSHPSQMPTLIQKIHNAVHPGGAPYQAPAPALPTAVPKGGTAEADTELYANRMPKLYVSPDGKQRDWFTKNDHPEGWTAVAPAAGSNVRQGTHILIPHDAIDLMNTVGAQFNKQDGTPWSPDELSQFPEGTALAQFVRGDQIYYSPIDQRTKTSTFNNVVSQIPEAGHITQDNLNPLGAAKVGTITTQASPSGQQVVSGTSTPMTVVGKSIPPSTGARPSAGARPAGSGAARIGGILPKTQPTSILPDIQHMTPRNAAMAIKTQPAVSALLGLYGDPANPAVRSMVDFSSLADNKHSQKVLGEAFKLLNQSMGEISDPGIIQTLATKGGWANFRAQAESQAQQKTGTQMTPEEREYFDTAIASMADIIGSRSATGQGAQKFSVDAIQSELPLIGLSGTPDSRSYLTKMQTIGRQVRVGLNGMPDNGRALGWLSKRESDIAQMQKGGTSPSGGSSTAPEVWVRVNGKLVKQ